MIKVFIISEMEYNWKTLKNNMKITLSKRKKILEKMIIQRKKEICKKEKELMRWKDELNEIDQKLEDNTNNSKRKIINKEING